MATVTAPLKTETKTLFEQTLEVARRVKRPDWISDREQKFDELLFEAIESAYKSLEFEERMLLNEIMAAVKFKLEARMVDRARPMKINLGEVGQLELIGKIGVLLFLGDRQYTELRRTITDGKPNSPYPRTRS